MLRAPIKSFRVCISHQSDHRIRVCISHQSERRFCLRGVQISTKIWEIRGERFVNWNHLLEWETLAFLCFERVLYRNGNGILCTVARSWLLFLHDESEWKIFQSNIAWSVDELHQTFWFEQFFNGKLCCKIHYLLRVPIIFFWIGLLGAISRWMSD